MQTDQIEPTPEMVAFYERRTNEHIERVRRCLTLLAGVTDCGGELIERARVHDDGPQEGVGFGGQVAVEDDLSGLVEDAELHGPGVQIGAAVESVVLVEEAHRGPPGHGSGA